VATNGQLLPATIQGFQETVWEYYQTRGRHDLPWRIANDGDFDPYHIVVSEIMLQQTQVPRVIPKFEAFIQAFPTFERLGAAELGEVLRQWSGLGYNRRAKFLWQAAGSIASEYHGKLPRTVEELAQFPGIGKHTAGAILAYSFNQPVVFIETNIRTVFLYHFFLDADGVADRELEPYIYETLPEMALTREWYWALMDYGSYLKKQVGNVSRASNSYTKQSRFEGSARQIRGQVLRLLADKPMAAADLQQAIADERLLTILQQLVAEQLIHESDKRYSLEA
jgi:A/G-specific adenine glycosylase